MSAIPFPPVNRLAPELLKFLGIKSPVSPDLFLSAIQPSVEMRPWWSYGIEQTITGSSTWGAATTGWIGAAARLPVPVGALWLVNFWGMRISGAAVPAGLVVQAALFNPVDTIAFPVGPLSTTLTSLDGMASFVWSREDWLIVPTGWELRLNALTNTSAGAVTATNTVRIAQFEG